MKACIRLEKTIYGITLHALFANSRTEYRCKVISEKPEFRRMEKAMAGHPLFMKKQ